MNVHRNDQKASLSSRSSPSGEYNASPSDSSSVTYKGVRYRSEQNKWVAEIRPPRSNKTWWLGTYCTPVEAAYAYDVAITYFGSETSLNFDGHPVYDQIPRISPNLPKQDFAVQLRKVVKEYGKLAMKSIPSPEVDEDEEEQASSSSYGAHDQYMTSSDPASYEYPQQEEYFEEIDWEATLIPTEADHSFSASYDTCFDFEVMAPVPHEDYNGITYQPASDYEPASGMYYTQMSPAISSYESSGHYNGHDYPQQQLWSPYCNQYSSY